MSSLQFTPLVHVFLTLVLAAVLGSTHARENLKVVEQGLRAINDLSDVRSNPEAEAIQTQLSEQGVCAGACQAGGYFVVCRPVDQRVF